MAKRSEPIIQGFGRVIYLTLIRRLSNRQVQQNGWDTEKGEQILETLRGNEETITICFDPWRTENNNQKGQLNTRIDFQVKHMGDAGVGNNGFYVTANIDVWNIGPALEQFLDAYNAYKNEYKDVQTKKYAVILQVGFKGSKKRTTVFAGHISSFICDRQQSNSTVDNVWHFLCQYPDPQQNNEVGNNKVKVKDGEEYTPPTKEEWNASQTFLSWENFMKTALCYHKQTVYVLRPTNIAEQSDSFSVLPIVKEDDMLQMSTLVNSNLDIEIPMVPSPERIYLTMLDFDKYFSIEYRVSRNSPELPTVKELWQQKIPIKSWNLDVSSIQASITSIARAINCHARLEMDENTGHQTIYIYPAGWAEVDVHFKGKADYTIVDYQNLQKPPRVSANMFHLDMIMEPEMRPGSVIELQISEVFKNKYEHPTFEPSFSMANTATVFAGSNFIGLAQMGEEEKKRNAVASAGNIFNTKFIATIVEHKGSSHTSEWSTSVDCYGIVAKNGKVVTE